MRKIPLLLLNEKESEEIQNHHRRGEHEILKLNSTSFLINLYKLVVKEREEILKLIFEEKSSLSWNRLCATYNTGKPRASSATSTRIIGVGSKKEEEERAWDSDRTMLGLILGLRRLRDSNSAILRGRIPN